MRYTSGIPALRVARRISIYLGKVIGTGNNAFMNIRDFEYIIAVDKHRHFGKAAEACNVGQPTLSSQIKKLEEHLGLDIFERTKRSVDVTPAGAEIIRKAKALMQIVEEIRDVSGTLKDPLSGPLRLGAIPTIAPYLMPLLLPSFTHALPNAELRLSEHFTRDLEEAVTEGDLDAAIIASKPTLPQLTSIPLYKEPFWIALPTGHPLCLKEEIAIRELAKEQILLLADGHCLRDQILSLIPARNLTSQKTSTEETSLNTILALVGGGYGVTFVPAMSISGPWVTDAGISVRKEKSGKANRHVHLIFRRSYSRMTLINKLADIIAAIVPDTVSPAKR